MLSSEARALEWASRAVRRPWFQLLEVVAKRASGEPLTAEERIVSGLFELPFNIDAVWLYRFLRIGSLAVLFDDRPSLFTLVANSSVDRVLWLGIQVARGGLYTGVTTLHDKLPAGWDEDLLACVRQNSLDAACTEIRRLAAELPEPPEIPERVTLNLADIRFFAAFSEAAERGRAQRALLPLHYARAAVRVSREGWVRFHPNVPFDRALRMVSKLSLLVGPFNSELRQLLDTLVQSLHAAR